MHARPVTTSSSIPGDGEAADDTGARSWGTPTCPEGVAVDVFQDVACPRHSTGRAFGRSASVHDRRCHRSGRRVGGRHSQPWDIGAALEDIAGEDDSLLLSPATGSGTGITQVGVGTAAVPATADDVPTHYEVHGSTLTQIVDHTGGRFAYPVVADPIWLAPWVVRCLIGIGINGATITRIASSGSPGAVLAAFGYGAFRCVLGR